MLQLWLPAFMEHISHTESVVQLLSDDLLRECVYGPSAGHVPAAQTPHAHKMDISFHRNSNLDAEGQENLGRLKKAAAQIDPENKLGLQVEQLIWYHRSTYLPLAAGIKDCPAELKQLLEIEGESGGEAVPLPGLLLTLETLCEQLVDSGESSENMLLVWGRLSLLHNRILSNPVHRLGRTVLLCLQEYLRQHEFKGRGEYIQMQLEYAYALLFYYKYNSADRVIGHCAEALGIKVSYTGRLGRRTKYQSFDVAQLVMQVSTCEAQGEKQQEGEERGGHEEEYVETERLVFPEVKHLIDYESSQEWANTREEFTYNMHDSESILLETPAFKEESPPSTELNEDITLCVLAMLYLEWKTTPREDLQFMNIATGIDSLISAKCAAPLTYITNYSLMYLRSLNEYTRIKNIERSLEQMETLKAYYNQKEHKNVSKLFASSSETFFELIKDLAHATSRWG